MQARQNGQASVTLRGVLNCVQPVIGEVYTVDLRTMQQRSPRGFLRPVRIVDVGAAAAGGPVAVQVRQKGTGNSVDGLYVASKGISLGTED